ncbi:hypothetical protein DCAR_0728230 [Daucus carota subsp. sativus]|uniref:Uncharacterized protein n=1 Tax=Daucus carota subsp. sativus TaxID=79200 RepID=A0A164T9W1_DAUCS|nr:hypothetical protein DCAR_0728230 [Daucus carota subsp. sativus]
MRKLMHAYKFNQSLVSVGSNITLGVDNFTKWFTKFNQFLLSALSWQIPQMQDLGRRLCVAEL